jgi:hypothetical protein
MYKLKVFFKKFVNLPAFWPIKCENRQFCAAVPPGTLGTLGTLGTAVSNLYFICKTTSDLHKNWQ